VFLQSTVGIAGSDGVKYITFKYFDIPVKYFDSYMIHDVKLEAAAAAS